MHASFEQESGGSEKDRKQKFSQEERSEAVGAHVGFVALDACAADRGLANASIVPKNIEAGFFGEKGRSTGWECGEVAEVERNTFDVSRACCVNRLYGLDFSSNFDGRAAGDVDCATFGAIYFNELKLDA